MSFANSNPFRVTEASATSESGNEKTWHTTRKYTFNIRVLTSAKQIPEVKVSTVAIA